MDTDRYRALQRLFEELRDLPASRRTAEVDARCAGDPLLRQELLALLAVDDSASTAPLLGALRAAVAEGISPGDFLGPYRIIDRIGAGGFGMVFSAEQQVPVRRTVAIKVLHPGLNSAHVVARFRAEQQALALMDHPNIARIYDAGITPAGLPYFVMQLVPGDPITRYCEQASMSVRDRIRLFEKVCGAVQHAHAKGVIHRDLKPSNILVTRDIDGEAQPMVIDFGVAKAITADVEETRVTAAGQAIGTWSFMSPEQAEARSDVDTRSDIYSLGVVLYELLTGLRPFDEATLRQAGSDEIRRILRTVDPPSPSQRLSADGTRPDRRELTRTLRSELEWIPMRAMEREPGRRYQTAAALADDLRNYLDGRPLVARPVSRWYRLRKFVRLHRGAVTALLAVSLSLLGGIIATSFALLEARARAAGETKAKNEAVARGVEAVQASTEAIRQRERVEYESYVANIEMGLALAEAGRPDFAQRRLERCPPGERRNFEWLYLHTLLNRSLSTLGGHTAEVNDLALSPTGHRIATASVDRTIRLWDGESSAQIAVLDGHTAPVLTLAFSPDGTILASGSDDGTVRLWSAADGSLLRVLEDQAKVVHEVLFSADGATIAAVCRDDTVRLWRPSGEQLPRLRGEGVLWTAAFSPDGRTLIAGGDSGELYAWETATGVRTHTLRAHERRIRDVAFAPDGRRIVTASEDRTARAWDLSDPASSLVFTGHGNFLRSAAFSADGTRLLTASDDATARVWDTSTGAVVFEIRGHRSGLNSARFSADGTKIVTSSDDCTSLICSSSLGAVLSTLVGHTMRVQNALFTPDGARVVTASLDGTARVWDAGDAMASRELRGHFRMVRSLGLSSDERLLVSGSADTEARVWDLATGQSLRRLRGHSKGISATLFADGDAAVLSASLDGTIRVWDAASGESLRTLTFHTAPVLSLATRPDGVQAMSGAGNDEAFLWDVGTGQVVRSLAPHGGRYVAWSEDGRFMATATPNAAFVLAADTGELIATIDATKGDFTSLAFSPDANSLITTTMGDVAQRWALPSGQPLQTYTGHASRVWSASVSPDGRRMATASFDRSVRIWDVETGVTLADLHGHTLSVTQVRFSHDGSRLFSCSNDGGIRVWDSQPSHVRAAVRAAQQEGRDGAEIIRAWMKRVGSPE